MSRLPGSARAAGGFLEINRQLAETGSLAVAQQDLVSLAVACIDSCDWAAITEWRVGKKPRNAAASDAIASRVDEIQYAVMEGPCLTAAESNDPIHISELADDNRWPAFRDAVLAESPVRAVLAFPIGDHPDRMALNTYGGRSNCFDEDQAYEAGMFAAQAAMLMLHAKTADKREQLSRALDSSRRIGTAVGILMARNNASSDEALASLKETSNRLHEKVRDVADYVNRAGVLPA